MKINFLKNFIPKWKKRGKNKIRPNLKRGAKEGIYGHVDIIDQTGISGWFVDLSETKPELTVLINDIPVGKISNFFYRQDIAQLLGKYHLAGFKVNWIELNIPGNLFDEQLWNVEVFYEKVNKPLAGANQIGKDVINVIKELMIVKGYYINKIDYGHLKKLLDKEFLEEIRRTKEIKQRKEIDFSALIKFLKSKFDNFNSNIKSEEYCPIIKFIETEKSLWSFQNVLYLSPYILYTNLDFLYLEGWGHGNFEVIVKAILSTGNEEIVLKERFIVSNENFVTHPIFIKHFKPDTLFSIDINYHTSDSKIDCLTWRGGN
ncbi:MAG: hypothetical protein J7K20_05245, partial [Thermodesulfobacterium sp.]|nr:hypothetical protein [Thermodesulfobacterium sp.]